MSIVRTDTCTLTGESCKPQVGAALTPGQCPHPQLATLDSEPCARAAARPKGLSLYAFMLKLSFDNARPLHQDLTHESIGTKGTAHWSGDLGPNILLSGCA